MALDPIITDSQGKNDPASVNSKLAALRLAESLSDPKNPSVNVVTPEFLLSESLLSGVAKFFLVYPGDEETDEEYLCSLNL